MAPLGRGFLAGSVTAETKLDRNDLRNNVRRFSEDNRRANQGLVDALRKIASGKGVTPAQIAFAWILAQRAVDRANPRHYQNGAAGGKPRRRNCATDGRRS